MAHTNKGRCIGRAAQIENAEFRDQYILDRTPQDIRIGYKKAILRKAMGTDAFTKFYRHTSFISDVLERQLDEKIKELGVENVNSD